MKRMIVIGLSAIAIAPATAMAQPTTGRHFGVYRYLYRHARAQFGSAVGCELMYSCHGRISDAKVHDSIGVLQRMLWPAPVRHYRVVSYRNAAYHSTATSTTSSVSAPSSSLEQCIIEHESGGNAQAVNGPYEGEGQWSPSAWAQDGGTRYAASPLGASAAQQEQVLAGEGAAGMAQQQGQYDGCG
jgi:hypothetical protein